MYWFANLAWFGYLLFENILRPFSMNIIMVFNALVILLLNVFCIIILLSPKVNVEDKNKHDFSSYLDLSKHDYNIKLLEFDPLKEKYKRQDRILKEK